MAAEQLVTLTQAYDALAEHVATCPTCDAGQEARGACPGRAVIVDRLDDLVRAGWP